MKHYILTAALLASVLLCGCGDRPTGEKPQMKTATVGEGAESDDAFRAAQASFSLRLMQETVRQDGSANILLSPYSLMQALAMTANGAAGETRTECEEVLGGMEIEVLNDYMLGSLNQNTAQFQSANSLWLRDTNDLRLRDTFLNNASNYYKADVFKGAFDQDTRNDINNWCSEKTDGQIPEILSEPIPPDAYVYLINAVNFDAKWKTKYEDEPRDVIFEAANGKNQFAQMMYSDESIYIHDEDAIGFIKPYKDGKYAFAALLPNEGMTPTQYLEQLSPEKFQAVLSNTEQKTIHAGLPQFSLDYGTALQPILKEMGIKILFENADLSEMIEKSDGYFVSEIVQKTHIEVDTNGTKAAAATEVGVESGCESEEDSVSIYLTRPFLYMIIDMETDQPVFFGVLNEIPQ